MSEQWLPIPGYERTYMVSSEGRVWSKPRRRTKGGLLSVHVGKRGYPLVSLVQDGIQKTREVHRLVALAFIGPRPEGREVRHLDGNCLRPHVDNLAYGTRSENQYDLVAHGRHVTAGKTHCPQGHPYDEENTRLYQGRRYCRTCGNRRTRNYKPEWQI